MLKKELTRMMFVNHPILRHHLSLYDKLIENFDGGDTLRFYRAPGRVNMIGEHTDYNMGPVLPCAIDKEIIFCVKNNNTNLVRVKSVEPEYEDLEFSLEQPIEPYPKGHWGNYTKAGVKGILDFYKSMGEYKDFRGFDAIVSGNIPKAAGLSSSSALVVCATICFLAVNNIMLEKIKIADICARAEHFVGTAGGGMDQAVSLLGEKNAFVKIAFNPLRTEIIKVPAGISIVIFDSMVKAEKSGLVRDEYNRRVLECKLSVALFKKFLQEKKINDDNILFIGNINSNNLHLSQADLDDLVDCFLHQLKPQYQLQDLIEILDLTMARFTGTFLHRGDHEAFKVPEDGFKLTGRFRHVYSECKRVELSKTCLSRNDIVTFGKLMNASQASMNKDYEISTPAINELTEKIIAAGAYGARLTGAGFGGMIVSVVAGDNLEQLIATLEKKYYQEKNTDATDHIFTCNASEGAGEIFAVS